MSQDAFNDVRSCAHFGQLRRKDTAEVVKRPIFNPRQFIKVAPVVSGAPTCEGVVANRGMNEWRKRDDVGFVFFHHACGKSNGVFPYELRTELLPLALPLPGEYQ